MNAVGSKRERKLFLGLIVETAVGPAAERDIDIPVCFGGHVISSTMNEIGRSSRGSRTRRRSCPGRHEISADAHASLLPSRAGGYLKEILPAQTLYRFVGPKTRIASRWSKIARPLQARNLSHAGREFPAFSSGRSLPVPEIRFQCAVVQNERIADVPAPMISAAPTNAMAAS